MTKPKMGRPSAPASKRKRFSGVFLLRIGKPLHRDLALLGEQEGRSLNAQVDYLLRRALGWLKLTRGAKPQQGSGGLQAARSPLLREIS